jgi:exodeoxyribonuclease VII large subunit
MTIHWEGVSGDSIRWMNSDDLPLFSAKNTAPNPAPDAGFRPLATANAQAISVSALNRRVKGMLEANFELQWVRGELSNVMRAASGHWYFSLKDDAAQVRCVMFKSRAQAVSFTPENGVDVEVRALPSLYEARGEFQLGVETMRRAGLGALFEAFERLKRKLADEGLFDEARKRTLPAFPRVIGIVTSTKAAALRDVLTTLKRRAPMIRIIIYHTAVQGADAPREIAAAIDAARARNEIDALLVCRGGGSMEDLWAFNNEAVARAIYRLQIETEIAVVSGVGHETDFTIADFVADTRAPTPTAGAELLSPDTEEIRANLIAQKETLTRSIIRQIRQYQQRLDFAARSLVSPTERIRLERHHLGQFQQRLNRALHAPQQQRRITLDTLRARLSRALPNIDAVRLDVQTSSNSLKRAVIHNLTYQRAALDQHAQALNLLNPNNVLTRGYAIVTVNGKGIATSVASMKVNDAISVRMRDGEVVADVKAILGSADGRR